MASIDDMIAQAAQEANNGPLPADTNFQSPSAPSKSSATPAAPAPTPKDNGSLSAAVGGAYDMATFGFGDELDAVGSAILPAAHFLYNRDDTKSVWSSGQSLSDTVAANLAAIRASNKAEAAAHPVANVVGQVAGGALVPFGAGARTVGGFAKVGAAVGAAHGLGSGEGIGGRLEEAAKEGAVGAGLGPAAYAAHGILGGLLSKIVGRAAPEMAPTGETPPTAPEGSPSPAEPQQPSKVVAMGQDSEGNPVPVFQADPSVGPEGRPGKMVVDVTPEGDTVAPAPTEGKAGGPEGDPLGAANDDVYPKGQHPEDIEARQMAADARARDNASTPRNDNTAQTAAEDALRRLNEAEDRYWVNNEGITPAEKVKLQEQMDQARADYEAATGKDPNGIADLNPRNAIANIQREAQHWSDRVASEGDRAADTTAEDPNGQQRLGNLGDSTHTVGLMRTLINGLPAKGVLTDQELMASAKAGADEIGSDPATMAQLGAAIAGDSQRAAQGIAVFRTVWKRASDEVKDLYMAGIDWDTASDDMVATAGEAIRNHSILSQMMQQTKAGAGRALRVFSLPDADTYTAQLLAKGASKAEGEAGATTTPSVDPAGEPSPTVPGAPEPSTEPGGQTPVDPAPGDAIEPGRPPALPTDRQGIRDHLDALRLLDGDPEGQADWLANRLSIPSPSKYLRTSFANLFTADILSAPKTVFLNLIGPGFINTIRTGEKMFGGYAMQLNPLISAEERAAGLETARLAPRAAFQTLGDIGDAFRFAMKAAEQNRTVIGGGGTVTDAGASFGPITPNLLDRSNQSESFAYSLGNMINVLPKVFARVNAGLDEAAKRLGAMGEIRLRAMVDASTQGLTGEDAQAFVRSRLQNSFDETGALKDAEILRAAESNTLTNLPGEDGSWVNRFSKGLIALRRDVPETRFLLPVYNVSANSLGQTFKRIPVLGMLRGQLALERDFGELSGDFGPVAQAEAHGRWMTGAAFLTAGLLMNRHGMLTGAGPQNPTDRKVWLQTHQPYSIRVGDEWVRYDKFDILGGLLSIPATIADATTNRPADESTGNLISGGMGALAQWFKDRAALRNATALLSTGDNPTQNTGRFLSNTAGSTAAGLIPGSGLLGAAVNVSDPYARMKSNWTDFLRANIPLLSNTLEPVRNTLGEPMNRSSDTFAEQLFPVTMAPATTYQSDPVLDEMDRLYRTTGYGAGADPKALGYGYFDPRHVKLEDGVSMYTHFMQGRQTMEIGGKTLRESLMDTINSDAYNRAVDADPQQAKTSLGDASRGYMVKQVFDRYNEAIKAEMGAASPTALKYLTAAAAKQRDDAYLNGTSADDLVNNPQLYATHGINPDAYAAKITRGATGRLLQTLPR